MLQRQEDCAAMDFEKKEDVTMRVLIIPDVHLKPWMFRRASEMLKNKAADRAVCLMDLADSHQGIPSRELYEQTYDAAIRFAEEYPDTLWCYGNHDAGYLWEQHYIYYDRSVSGTVREKLRLLRSSLPDERQLAVAHRIDNVIFCHGGLSASFVMQNIPEEDCRDVDRVLERINHMGRDELWDTNSPLWFRPQYDEECLYRAGELLQVVGHTPVHKVRKTGTLVSCDIFHIYRAGSSDGSLAFPVLDTQTWELDGFKYGKTA